MYHPSVGTTIGVSFAANAGLLLYAIKTAQVVYKLGGGPCNYVIKWANSSEEVGHGHAHKFIRFLYGGFCTEKCSESSQ